MLDEDLYDDALILRGILIQPLDIEELKEDEIISLLSAAENYVPGQGSSSELSRVLHSFLKYPGQTDTLVKELKVIANELDQNA